MTKETKNLLKVLKARKKDIYECFKIAEEENNKNIDYEKGRLLVISEVIDLIESKKCMKEVAKIYGVYLD